MSVKVTSLRRWDEWILAAAGTAAIHNTAVENFIFLVFGRNLAILTKYECFGFVSLACRTHCWEEVQWVLVVDDSQFAKSPMMRMEGGWFGSISYANGTCQRLCLRL